MFVFMLSYSSAFLFVMVLAILWPISYIRKGKYRPTIPTSEYVTLRVPPLNSATGWTGELWLNRGKLSIARGRGGLGEIASPNDVHFLMYIFSGS